MVFGLNARGEGCGAVLLTQGEESSWLGSGVLLCASTSNQDGRSATLTAPNGQAQEEAPHVLSGKRASREVILDALWMAALPPSAVGLVECHGTGTALGDPIEVGSLRAVVKRPETAWLGAGKTNVGHLEVGPHIGGIF